MSLAIWHHRMVPTTQHNGTHTGLTPAIQAGTQFACPRGMEGWVDLGGWLHAKMVDPLSTNLAAHGWKLSSQPVDHKSDTLTTSLPNHL